MKYRTLVFDFDGTIADTLDESLKIYNQMALRKQMDQMEKGISKF